MNKHFNYPAKLTKQPEGGYLVEFPDLPEAITQGDDLDEALYEAIDCLEEAVANRIIMKLDLPLPSNKKRGQYIISMHVTMSAKAALYLLMKEQHLNNSQLARKIDCDEKEIRRLIDPYYNSKIPNIENALYALGSHLEIGFSSNTFGLNNSN